EKGHALESEGVDGSVAERTINVWLGPDTHIVLFPLGTTGALNMVISFSTDQIQPLVRCPDSVPDRIGQLRRYFEPWDTRLAKLLLRAREASRWELRFCDGSEEWVHADGKFGLTGDAGHAMLPEKTKSKIPCVYTNEHESLGPRQSIKKHLRIEQFSICKMERVKKLEIGA
ncbi:MAG: hypothetical protein Q9175_007790, partial [Cornicularia normoerica]